METITGSGVSGKKKNSVLSFRRRWYSSSSSGGSAANRRDYHFYSMRGKQTNKGEGIEWPQNNVKFYYRATRVVAWRMRRTVMIIE